AAVQVNDANVVAPGVGDVKPVAETIQGGGEGHVHRAIYRIEVDAVVALQREGAKVHHVDDGKYSGIEGQIRVLSIAASLRQVGEAACHIQFNRLRQAGIDASGGRTDHALLRQINHAYLPAPEVRDVQEVPP